MDKTKKETLENLMRKDGVDVTAEEDRADAITLDEPKKRTWLIVTLTVLATLLIAGGAYVAYQSYTADKELTAEEKIENSIEEEVEEQTTMPTSTAQTVYINAAEGLNMRKEPNSSSEVLKIIPFGTKLTVLETSGDWYKVEYDSATGWCAKLFTASENPLVYKNTDYGFGLTFPTTWSTYTVEKRSGTEAGVTAYYDVFLVTSDTETYPNGKSSMFVVAIYTPSEWVAISAGEGPKPGVLKETAKYVYAYSPSQAAPEDLMARRDDINAIVKTFVEL